MTILIYLARSESEVLNRIRDWWAGEFRPTPLEAIFSGSPFENVRRPWLARAGKALTAFYLRHWQFLLSTALSLLALLVAIVALSGCSPPDRWLGFVYQDRTDLTQHVVTGEYDSLNACLDAVNSSAGPNGTYECGKNCRTEDGMSVMICAETVGNEK